MKAGYYRWDRVRAVASGLVVTLALFDVGLGSEAAFAEEPLAPAPGQAPVQDDPDDRTNEDRPVDEDDATAQDQRTDIDAPTEGDRTQDIAEEAPPWVIARPAASLQKEKSNPARGSNPCDTADPGFGVYSPWITDLSFGKLLLPERGGLTPHGEFDLMIHFHGREPMRKEWTRVMDGTALLTVDLGIDSESYARALSKEVNFSELLKDVERAVSERAHLRARVRHVGLSAWSAGYGALGAILAKRGYVERVDTVVLLDALHSGYTGKELNARQLAPYVDFARQAAAGKKLMFVSHSSISPSGYASTTETANYLVWKAGGRPEVTTPRGTDPLGLDLISRFSGGGLHVRGYAGGGQSDHCAHVGLMRDVLSVHVKRRWDSPRGFRQETDPPNAAKETAARSAARSP